MTTSPLSRFLDCMLTQSMSVKIKKRARHQQQKPHPGKCRTCWKVSRYLRELRGLEMSARYAWILLFTQSIFPVVISSVTCVQRVWDLVMQLRNCAPSVADQFLWDIWNP